MGIDPNHFGPYFWATIHLICLGVTSNLSNDQKNGYCQFFNNIHYVLPCASCGEHLRDNMRNITPIEEVFADPSYSSDSLFYWSVDLHNIVNDKLGKPRMTHQDAYKFWRNAPYATFNKNTKDTNSDKNDEVIKIVYKENYSQPIQMFLIFIIGLLIGVRMFYCCRH